MWKRIVLSYSFYNVMVKVKKLRLWRILSDKHVGCRMVRDQLEPWKLSVTVSAQDAAFNPSSPEHFSRTYFPKGVVATPHDYQYEMSYNPKVTTIV